VVGVRKIRSGKFQNLSFSYKCVLILIISASVFQSILYNGSLCGYLKISMTKEQGKILIDLLPFLEIEALKNKL
jgi:hypothetical protein